MIQTFISTSNSNLVKQPSINRSHYQSMNTSTQADPPPASMLRKAATFASKILASGPTKFVAGVLIFAGIALLFTGAGAFILAAGVGLFVASTAMSTAQLENKDPKSIAVHLVRSTSFVLLGASIGALIGFGAGGAAALALPIAFYLGSIGTTMVGGLLGGLANYLSSDGNPR